MAGIMDIYGGAFLNAAYVKDKKLAGKPLTITDSRLETLKEKDKVLLAFAEADKELVLNKSNAGILAESFGDDYTQWKGRKLLLVVTKVPYQGQSVDSIQVVPQ